MLQVIIFDMDGVIVDTEYLEFKLQKDFIAKLNIHNRPISHQEYSEVVGQSLKEIPHIVKKLSGSDLPIEQIRADYYQFFQQIFSDVDYLSIFRQDILKIIQYAKQHQIKLAVASSSAKAHIDKILTACGIYQEFDLIVSGEQFERSKPDPTIYRYTLEKLGVSAENAVAIEDSYHGMVAAKGAGLKVIGYQETRMDVDQSLADFIGKDMREILAIIQKL